MENLELFEGVARWLAGLVETPSYDVNIWFVLLVLVVWSGWCAGGCSVQSSLPEIKERLET